MIYKDDGGHGGLYLLMRQSDAVMHYSTLYDAQTSKLCTLANSSLSRALVQYADTSAPRGISPALASARKALSLNVEAHTLYKHLPDFIWVGHCHWTLLKAPITPFVVTFGQIIANPSTSDSDLHLLADFVATLRELRRYSEGMVKLYRLCDVFCKVAFLYVQAKAHEAEQELGAQHNDLSANPPQQWFGQPAVNDIDGYLSTIGFLPQSSNTNDVATAFDDNAEFDASFLADWFNGQNSLMGFLEQDIVSFGDADFSGVPGLNGDGIPSGTIYQQPP